MQPQPRQPRAPGSFSPLPALPTGSSSMSNLSASAKPRPQVRRVESSESDDSTLLPPIPIAKIRSQQSASPVTPVFPQHPNPPFTAHANSSSSSLHQNFSRPNNATRAVTQAGSSSPQLKGHHHSRKHSATQGLFDSTLPSTSTSNLSQITMAQQNQHYQAPPAAAPPTVALTASQIAAQAAFMSKSQHQQQQHPHPHQQQQHQQLHHHTRHRSQTVPFPGDPIDQPRRGSATRGPLSPPMLSLTEASAPRDTVFGQHGTHGQTHDRFGTSHSSAATAAANVVFPRSGRNSPNPNATGSPNPPQPPAFPAPQLDRQVKPEKSKVKLFSRPNKISTKGETKEKPLPSPGKIGSALSALQRHNFSTNSLVDSGSSTLYNMSNSSSATIRPADSSIEDRGGKEKEKEKKHHFLSRQKNKLKDEYHLPLSSAASNSRPTDPNAPTSLYSFNVPASPGPNSSFAKAKKDKKYGERPDGRLESESSFTVQGDWPGPSSLPSQSSMYDPVDPGKLGLHNHMSIDDAWPYLKSKLLVIFDGEDLRLPVEDLNRVAQMHIQYCIHKRSPKTMLEDLRDLLSTGFSSLDHTLRKTPEDRFIPTVVELWLFTFTSILPYMQAVFLPLELEVSGCGTQMTAEQAREFWSGVRPAPADKTKRAIPASTVLDVRRLVLKAYRDIIILPRYDMLKTIFSRLSLEFLPSLIGNAALASPPPSELILSTSPSESFSSMARPGTAMSLDPSVASYNSSSSTLLGEGSASGGRSRAISNVSFGSHGSVREQNIEDSKQVTDMVGRMLQCMSVLSSIGAMGVDGDDEGNLKVVELCKMLKLNWLGRGRTGRNRRGIVGGRVRRDEIREELRVI